MFQMPCTSILLDLIGGVLDPRILLIGLQSEIVLIGSALDHVSQPQGGGGGLGLAPAS